MEVFDHRLLWGAEAMHAMSRIDPTPLRAVHPIWEQEDPRQFIRDGAALLLANDGGWAILQVYDGERRELFVLGAYSPKGGVYRGITALKEIAVRLNCEIISFASTRGGWRRRAPKLGFTFTPQGEYEMRVD